MSDNVPICWTRSDLSHVVDDYQSGFASGNKDEENGLYHLRMNNISNDGRLNLDLLRTVPVELARSNHYLRKGDLLICTTNSAKLVGKSAIFDKDGIYAFSNHLTRIRVRKELINNRYLFYYLFMLWQQGGYELLCKHWVNQSTIPKEKLFSIEIPLAPLDEQNRVVNKLDVLLSKANACKLRLEKIPAILKRFRQSVLSAATSGALTKKWRENEDVRAWKVVRVEEVASRVFDGPFGSHLKSKDYTNSGIRVIRLENIGWLNFVANKETFIPAEKYESLRKHTLLAQDILFSSFISEEVRVCLLPDTLSKKAINKADCFCIRTNEKVCITAFLAIHLACRSTFVAFEGKIHGATRPRINLGQLKRFTFELPPLEEQKEIVRRVEALFKIADDIEKSYEKARAHVDKLTRSILAKAFRGELVPQDPNDEPASELLTRIRHERASKDKMGRVHSKRDGTADLPARQKKGLKSTFNVL